MNVPRSVCFGQLGPWAEYPESPGDAQKQTD